MKNRSSLTYMLISAGAITLLLLVLLIGAVAGGLLLAPYLSRDVQAATLAQPASGLASIPALQANETDLMAAYEKALIEVYRTTVPSVVSIRVTQQIDHPPISDESSPFPQTPPDEFFNRGQGSGFVWDTEGHIVTNNHVVADATDVEVVFSDGSTAEAKVLGTDPNSDLAVIKVDRPAAALQAVTLGDSNSLQVGQITFAIGSPFGQEFTMTSGIVSAVDRTIQSGATLFSIPEVIQTDAAINPGNSGGPLLDRQGRVIGINSQIISRSGSNSGVGFAVPINTAKKVVPALIKGESYEYAWLGLTGTTLTMQVAELLELSPDTKGALVVDVVQDGPADKAGLRGSDKTVQEAGQDLQVGGDVITAIDGQPVKGISEIIAYLVENTGPGDEVKLDVIRANGQRESVTVTLGVRPSSEEVLSQQRP